MFGTHKDKTLAWRQQLKCSPTLIVLIVICVNLMVINTICLTVYFSATRALNPERVAKDMGINFNEPDLGIPYALEHIWNENKLLGLHSLYSTIVREMERVQVADPKDKRLLRFGLDVSTNREFSAIWDRLTQLRMQANHNWVVDVGAMDGVSGSNSFNFIQMGWSALLVEPFPRHVTRIKDNLERYMTNKDGRGSADNQRVIVEQALISDTDGKRTLYVYPDASKTSNSVNSDHRGNTPSASIEVQSYTAKSLMTKYKIPKDFGVLTIDAEGIGDQILADFMAAGYRPYFIIFEISEDTGMQQKDEVLLEPLGYKVLRTLYNNNIWELQRD